MLHWGNLPTARPSNLEVGRDDLGAGGEAARAKVLAQKATFNAVGARSSLLQHPPVCETQLVLPSPSPPGMAEMLRCGVNRGRECFCVTYD